MTWPQALVNVAWIVCGTVAVCYALRYLLGD